MDDLGNASDRFDGEPPIQDGLGDGIAAARRRSSRIRSPRRGGRGEAGAVPSEKDRSGPEGRRHGVRSEHEPRRRGSRLPDAPLPRRREDCANEWSDNVSRETIGDDHGRELGLGK